jgi:hypothetical protein
MPSAEFHKDAVRTWSAEDIAFAATEIAREFPAEAPVRVAGAVQAATSAVAPTEGRASLVIIARRQMRGPGG